jgi:hypothetical protein
MIVPFADGYGNGSPVPALTTLEGMGRIDTDGPAVGWTRVLLSLATVLAGPIAVPDGAEPVGAMTVSLPTGYGAETWVGTVEMLLAGPTAEVEDAFSVVTVIVDVIIFVTSRVRVVVASGVGASPPLG